MNAKELRRLWIEDDFFCAFCGRLQYSGGVRTNEGHEPNCRASGGQVNHPKTEADKKASRMKSDRDLHQT